MRKIIQAITFLAIGSVLGTAFFNCSGNFTTFSGASTTAAIGSNTVVTTPTAVPTAAPTPYPLAISSSQSNVLPFVVSSTCGTVQNNMPCVTITVCVPGTTTCQTIPNILLDTGSFGLRIYNQVAATGDFTTITPLTITLPMIADPANSANVYTQCETFGGFSTWGPMVTADVTMGGETASRVPMQLVNSTFATIPSAAGCQAPSETASPGPTDIGVNGVLGVGPLPNDCGIYCDPSVSNAASNGIYFSCPSSGSGTCTGVAVPVSSQVTNPVGLLAVDNNGVILQLPTIADAGAPEADGYLVFGIGTQSNNTPANTSLLTILPATDNGGNDYQRDFTTVYNGVSLPTSIIDSGSPYLFFNGPSSLVLCTDTYLNGSGFYCPTSELSLTATVTDGSGVTHSIPFTVASAVNIESPVNYAFQNIAAQGDSTSFDWGLPFFFGRTIYFGLQSHTSVVGAGPLYAY